jgi:hypothetical protein
MIRLTEQIAISADQHSYIVGRPRRRLVEGGESVTTMCKPRYYTSVTTALVEAVAQAMRDQVADGTITTLRQFIAEQKRLQDKFAELLKPLEG